MFPYVSTLPCDIADAVEMTGSAPDGRYGVGLTRVRYYYGGPRQEVGGGRADSGE